MIAAHGAHELRVRGVGLGVEQRAELRRDEAVVGDPRDRAERLAAGAAAGRRHHDLLIPRQDVARVVEVGELAEASK